MTRKRVTDTTTEWSIQDISRLAGTTSRTLRHYGQIGLLEPSRIGANGYRYYDQESLVRLQRILLLRELGLGLPAIKDVLDRQEDTADALRTHLEYLEAEQDRIARQIESVRRTLRKTTEGGRLMADEILDGFDHTQYKDEVISRWGQQAWDSSNQWWSSLSSDEQKAFQQEQVDIATAFAEAHKSGKSPEDSEVQQITDRHYRWVTAGWAGKRPNSEQFSGLGDMYVDDSRFRSNYDQHGEGTAEFIRDAMKTYADRNLAQ